MITYILYKTTNMAHCAARSFLPDTLNLKQFLLLRHWLLSVLNFYEFFGCIAYLCVILLLLVLPLLLFFCVFYFRGKALQLVTLNVKCTCCELRSPASLRERVRACVCECVCVCGVCRRSYQIGNVTYEWYMLSRGNCLLNIAHTPHVSAQITSVCAFLRASTKLISRIP